MSDESPSGPIAGSEPSDVEVPEEETKEESKEEEPKTEEKKEEAKPEEKKEKEEKKPEDKKEDSPEFAKVSEDDKKGLVADKFISKPKASIAEIVPFATGSGHLGAGSMTQVEWDIVLQQCGVFYGWIIDVPNSRIVRAPKQAFRLRPKSVQVAYTVKADGSTSLTPSKETPVQDVSQPPVLYKSGFPNFRVNDSSAIEVTAFETEFELSMARNDFNNFGVSTKQSVGAFGCSLSVGFGFSHAKSNSTKTTNTTYGKTLVARYLYPRCDVFLFPGDLEPTQELAEAVEHIRKTKSIVALRKLHRDFGQVFCQNLTLGGRLSSTKSISSTSDKTEEQEKEEFKTSFSTGMKADGTALGVPVQMETENKMEIGKGSSTSKNQTLVQTNEVAIFEATGGDTILANNPVKWAPSVGTPQNWRVINRDEHTSLFETLSLMPGYSEVQGWFIQAMPTVSEYITLDSARQNTIRLKLKTPISGLPQGSAQEYPYYLGHNPEKGSTPRLVGMKGGIVGTQGDCWQMLDYAVETPIFLPQTYKAPVILSYPGGNVGSTKWGARYNKEFTLSEWSIIGPFDDQLRHGSRVILRTKPYSDPNPPAQAPLTLGATGTLAPPISLAPPQPSSMIVFRNQQGVFVPGMSENDEYQYWRILKVGSDFDSGEHIKEGDEVRLSWAVEDQTTGFRDYAGDIFGRRRNHPPPELESSVLYLKMPWPRFELGADTPNTMFMGTSSSVEPDWVKIKVDNGPEYSYIAQDVSFRIDTVANDGYGDSADYLLRGLLGEGSKFSFSTAIGNSKGVAGVYTGALFF